MLAETYLKIKYKNKIYKLEELYNELNSELNLNDRSKDTFYCGLPKDAIIIYKEKEYDNISYDELLNIEDVELIFSPIEFQDSYLNILYDDFNFQYQIARVNLIKSIPIIQSDADINWNNTNSYVGMHYLRTTYFLNSSVAYRHLIDKLYKILGIIIDYNKGFNSFKEYIKGIDDRNGFNKYWNKIINKTDINGLDIEKIKQFRARIDDLADFLNDNNISNIVNEYKHRGLYIEKGLKIKHYNTRVDSNNAYITTLDDEYGKEVLEFDVDKKIECLREYNNLIVEFIKDTNTQEVLKHYKFHIFNIGIKN